jgi:hypothetical protein
MTMTIRSGARSPSGLGRFPFKEEVMGSNPIRATSLGVIDDYAARFPSGRFSAVRAASLQAASLSARRAMR